MVFVYIGIGLFLLLIILIEATNENKLIRSVYSKLKGRYSSKAKVYRNVYLETPDGEITEFDVVMVHRTGIYIVECLDVQGKVIGKEKDPEWYYEKHKGKKMKKSKFDNPLDMALSHRRTLNDYLRFANIEYCSIVCFPPKTNLKSVSLAEKETPVTDLNHLNKVMKKMIKVTDGYINKESTLTINETMKKFSKVPLKTKLRYKKEFKRK